MSEAVVERGIALVGAVIVGATALVQLKNEFRVHGLDAEVTKILLVLMAVGCGIALLAAVHVIGVRS